MTTATLTRSATRTAGGGYGFRFFETLHLFEDLRLERGDLLARGVGFANRGRVFVLLLGRHQITFGTFRAGALFDYFGFQTRSGVSRLVATAFKSPNFKSALIELSFDFSAPLGNGFQVFF